MWNICDRILFSVTRKEWMKYRISCECFWCSWYFCMCWCTKVIQYNDFNINIYISAIVFRLHLVCKNSYQSLRIITTTQHVLLFAATFECFLACVTKVVSPYNTYVWKSKRKFFSFLGYRNLCGNQQYMFPSLQAILCCIVMQVSQ